MMPDVQALLARHGLAGVPEEPMQHGGFSGARITRLTRYDGTTFVLKRSSLDADWIMQATADTECREARAAGLALPASIRTPVIDTARDGAGFALLMHEVSNWLLPERIDDATLDTVIGRMAELHVPLQTLEFPWCDLRLRLALLTPQTAAIAAAHGAPVAADITRGWRLFDRHATPRALALIGALMRDPSPLLRALVRLPAVLLHGDLKFDNVAIDPVNRVWLLDWAMTLVAPPAVEVGWFLAINSRRLPCALDDVMSRYAAAASMPAALRASHDALTVVCGLLLRGWRKALDAEEGSPEELRWWCDRVEAAAALLS